MKGDYSRPPRPREADRQVLLQQGRVLLDSDFNEQGALAARALRTLTRDLLGPHAGPAGGLGFAIARDGDGFTIAPGRYYVDGWLAVSEPVPGDGGPVPRRYDAQEAFPFPGATAELEAGRPYFFYLDAWERAVTPFEDSRLREIALGGPDTALRRQLVAQVRAIPQPADFADAGDAQAWLDEHRRRHAAADPAPGDRLPLLQAFVEPPDDPDETPCVADPLGGYRGLENQLYRVEIHAAPDDDDQAATGELTFKWSRDNGSVVAAWTGEDGDALLVDGVRDTAHGFSPGQWVELVDKVAELRGVPGVMVHLTDVEPGRLTYDPASASSPVPRARDLAFPLVRRWDQRRRSGQTLLGGAIVVAEDEDIPLERGISVRFPKLEAAPGVVRRYAVGDCWVFAARTASADIDWPFALEPDPGGGPPVKRHLAREPDGIEHAYAPLALADAGAGGAGPTSLQRRIKELFEPA